MLRFLAAHADTERRSALTVLVAMRWMLIAGALFQVNYRPGSDPGAFWLLNGLALGAVALNGALQYLLADERPIRLWFPITVGCYDAVAVTGAIAAVDGFGNPSFLLYYPALLAFVLVFPGKWSFVYTAGVMVAYTVAAVGPHDTFDRESATDQKALVLRLLTLAIAALTANLVVRLERTRRLEAVAAEAERAAEAFAAEQRAAAAERRVEDERRRLSREVHDGISQRVYMLALGLETAGVAAERTGDSALTERIDALHRVSMEALFETRNLLFDLGQVMAGRAELAELVRNQAREFTAITGIAAKVNVEGEVPAIPPSTVGEVFRIVQESLANVMRHSGAERTSIDLRYLPGTLAVRIADDGKGFDAQALREGNGLTNMRERAAALGGGATITSAPGMGTTVEVTIPTQGAVP